MPELGNSNIHKINRQLIDTYREGSDEFREIVDQSGMDYINHGSESVIIRTKPDGTVPEVVFSLDYKFIKDPKTAKEIYYSHRILSTLFPHNFPKFYSSWGSDDADSSGQVRENFLNKGNFSNDSLDKLNSQSKYPFDEVIKAKEALKLPFYFDSGYSNFHPGFDGGVYYLDWVKKEDKPFDTQAILSWMDVKNYSDNDKNIVRRSIERLETLK